MNFDRNWSKSENLIFRSAPIFYFDPKRVKFAFDFLITIKKLVILPSLRPTVCIVQKWIWEDENKTTIVVVIVC